ncbi:MAG: IPT/TIG domain-containing protein [Melioribacter sp.]|uniref:IPT/TIG domain-containing protein n=1 Tax=Rosettibacter primus TaxID=3111523 RepID=UPI00247BCBBE|nr:IPT/TIG domain-containing protein [Melioribacter sp.]
MKQKSLIITLVIVISIKFLTACKYDVAEPMWDKEFPEAPIPKITQVDPIQAKPGVNTITIQGENLDVSGTNVYFDNTSAEMVSVSLTKIVVRRPNLATESSYIKVVPNQALTVAKYGPYKIDKVLDRYGSFLDNLQLSVLAVDKNENLYVVEAASRNIVKVTPVGQKSIIGLATRPPTDAKVGPGGKLYMPGNNRSIDVVDLYTGEVKEWLRLPSGKVVKFGDFDANGYFYTGGTRSDLVIIAPDLSVKSAGVYTTDEILAIRVFNGYVYVASRKASSQEPAKIWRHSIDGNGNVGSKELVFDLSTSSEFSSRLIRGLAFSENGIMFIATDSSNPILIFDMASKQLDYFYKNIIPPYCKNFYWGNGSFLYMIIGDATAGQEWTVFRVDMGSKSAPYYGG